MSPSLPRDAFFGAGAGDQFVSVVPSLKLIAVRNGGTLDPGRYEETGRETRLFQPLRDALTNQ